MKLPIGSILPLSIAECQGEIPSIFAPPTFSPTGDSRERMPQVGVEPATVANLTDLHHRSTTFAATPHEVSRVPERAESGRILCLSLYSAITANQVFSLGKAKTEKKKKILVLGDKFSFPAFVRFIGCGAENHRLKRGSCAFGGPFPALPRQIFSDFRNLGRGLKLYSASAFLAPPFRRVSSKPPSPRRVNVCVM